MIPLGTNSAASLPVRSAAVSSSRFTLGSSPKTSSPSGAVAMARNIFAVGSVTVSDRRSMALTSTHSCTVAGRRPRPGLSLAVSSYISYVCPSNTRTPRPGSRHDTSGPRGVLWTERTADARGTGVQLAPSRSGPKLHPCASDAPACERQETPLIIVDRNGCDSDLKCLRSSATPGHSRDKSGTARREPGRAMTGRRAGRECRRGPAARSTEPGPGPGRTGERCPPPDGRKDPAAS
jgi:hypothetical protein